ncbi:MAG: squalene--hopene cyclase [Planctomycetes bacterium]|nr:squalene--hopene cyclase [Planctomycetota bacterium]
MPCDRRTVAHTLNAARQKLLAARMVGGFWEGELSGSALSTATASCALTLLDRAQEDPRRAALVRGGLTWLAKHQNADGGWGDTIDSPSNISTTTLCWAALGAGPQPDGALAVAAQQAESWMKRRVGDLAPAELARAIDALYGDDHTFSVPILTMCALAGRFGDGRAAWRHIPALPFELAACPPAWFRRFGLPVVSYALPALIAIGQARHHHRPTRNPLTRALRHVTRARTLRVLAAIQPESGGFLEAVPLTSFVVMSLASTGAWEHPVVERGCAFLTASVRSAGCWPIDTNLATWLTTLSVGALTGPSGAAHLTPDERARLTNWLLKQQYTVIHPYTQAPPGGWAWTDRSGGVPDSDDTAGALLALWALAGGEERLIPAEPHVASAALAGVRWLLNLQNRDGGIPTFCRGWGRLPFDHSSPDLTAHTLRAWRAWRDILPPDARQRIRSGTRKAVRYLLDQQRGDGSWAPLWFGNQSAPDQESPLYGTSRVLRAAAVSVAETDLGRAWAEACQRGVAWILSAQNADGGWGGAVSVASSIEETAIAVETLAVMEPGDGRAAEALQRGGAWLCTRTECGERFPASPIGLYFARLWYHERLYPLVFTVAALERLQSWQAKRRS